MLADIHISGIFALGLFLFGLVALVIWLLSAIVRGLFSLVRGLFGVASGAFVDPTAGLARLPCPHPRCGQANAASARFCGRCGRALRRSVEDRVA